MTPLYDFCKIIFYRIPTGGGSVHTFQNGAAIDIFSDFTGRTIVGYSEEGSSGGISLYTINTGGTAYNKATIASSGTTLEHFGSSVPNSNMSITVLIEDYQKD